MLTLDDEVIQHDRMGSGDGLARRIKILPGAPVARYRAIVSDETIDYLSEKYQQNPGFHNIVVTTGNCARHDAQAIYARDQFHFRFKKALVELADEVWTLLPLGKIMPVDWDREMLNKHVDSPNSSDDNYDTVAIPEGKIHRIVTTSRRPNDVLYNHFIHFKTATTTQAKNSNGALQYHFVPVEGADVCFNIADISHRTGVTQVELEFPHEWMTEGELREELLSAFGALNSSNH